MPGHGYGLPAAECKVGAALRKVKGSVCFGCYALKGHYMFKNVQEAQYRRLRALYHPLWVEAMILLILSKGDDHFRWHDSGDVQGSAHLRNIFRVCEGTPHVKHWLPTREYNIIKKVRVEDIPHNLVIRLSAHMIDKLPTTNTRGLTYSTVSTSNDVFNGDTRHCPAPNQGNACGECRDCWDEDVEHVTYHYH
jgi:hypothetical protein